MALAFATRSGRLKPCAVIPDGYRESVPPPPHPFFPFLPPSPRAGGTDANPDTSALVRLFRRWFFFSFVQTLAKILPGREMSTDETARSLCRMSVLPSLPPLFPPPPFSPLQRYDPIHREMSSRFSFPFSFPLSFLFSLAKQSSKHHYKES